MIHAGSKSLLGFVLAGLLASAVAQEAAPPQPSTHAGINPLQLVRLVVDNELKPGPKGVYFTYRDVKKKGNSPVEVKQMVETDQDLVLGRLISIGGKPLTPQQQQKEDERLHRLTDPGVVKDKQKSQQEDDQRVRRMVRALPDAFLYTYAGTESGKNGEVVVLNFKPNPAFDPPFRELRVYKGMAGSMRIAVPQDRIASLEATLIEDVDFGWGILGRLDKGGRFAIEETDVGDGHWELTSMTLSFTGKVLMFKHLDIQQHETTSDYRHVQGMNIAQALDMLKKTADDELASTHVEGREGSK